MTLYILLASLPPLTLSLAANLLLFRRLKRLRKSPVPSLEARDLLHDLTRRGQAIIRVEVVDASQLLIRSPRA